MSMPIIPASVPDQSPARLTGPGAQAGHAANGSVFSNVLQQQHGSRSAHAPEQHHDKGLRKPAQATSDDPGVDPDFTLALIIDSNALPMAQGGNAMLNAASAGHADTGRSIARHSIAGTMNGARNSPTLTGMARQDRDTAMPPAARHTAAAAQPHGSISPADTRPGTKNHPASARTGTPADGRQFATARQAADTGINPGSMGGTAGPEQAAATRPGKLIHQPAMAGVSQLPQGFEPVPAAAGPVSTSGSTALGAGMLPAHGLAVSQPFGQPQWVHDFNRQFVGFVQSAGTGHTHLVQMQLNPPELGPVQITLHIGDSTTHASFVSPHANVRQALENALPQLEQQMAQAGMSLGQADVSDQQPHNQHAFANTGSNGSGNSSKPVFSLDIRQATDNEPIQAASPRVIVRPDALIDTFA